MYEWSAVRPHPCGFCPFLKKSSGNPYLKILDFSHLLLRMPLIFFLQTFSLPPFTALLGHPVQYLILSNKILCRFIEGEGQVGPCLCVALHQTRIFEWCYYRENTKNFNSLMQTF